jgi:small ligand-binding sensory domain FIST
VRWASAISDRSESDALEDAIAGLRGRLDALDLAIVFASPLLARAVAPRLAGVGATTVVGCSGAGIIGAEREIEDRPALSITAAELPGARCVAFRVDPEAMPASADAWRAQIAIDDPVALLVLADPFSCDTQALIEGLDAAFPRVPKFGGLVSGGRGAGTNWLYANGASYRDGAVGVVFAGDLIVDTVVAQGCRPIGAPMVVTRGEGNLIRELDHKPPAEVIDTLYAALAPHDRQLLRHSLCLGIEMQDSLVHREGELLVRNIVGIDRESGTMAVGARLRPFQVIRFLLRDAATATDDLSRMLELDRARGAGAVEGALLFSCVDRGERLFGKPDHDSALFRRHLGPAPCGGFFCSGEIGPVGGATFVHGYTSSFALFRRRS